MHGASHCVRRVRIRARAGLSRPLSGFGDVRSLRARPPLMTRAELFKELDRLKATMISVATGGARIQDVQGEFAQSFDGVAEELSKQGIENPLPFRDLWQWYGHWSGSEDLKTYQARRNYVATLFETLIKRVQIGADDHQKELGATSMARRTTAQLRNGVDRIRKRIAEVEAVDPANLEKFSPDIDALQGKIDDTLASVFGAATDKYNRYRRTVYWAQDIPSFGRDTPLQEYREDVAKGRREVLTMLAAAIDSVEEELGATIGEGKSLQPSNVVFIGHGRSELWRALKDFLKDRLKLSVDEFNNVPSAGIPTADRLREMMKRASFAFLVMTAEDDQPDGKKRARENVVHEVGLFQGRLGFERAIVLLEEGCEEFSNIHGLGQIRFPKGNIGASFEEVRRVLEREKII